MVCTLSRAPPFRVAGAERARPWRGWPVGSILYQRGLYDPDTFERRKKYGLGLMVTSDQGLLDYLGPVLRQISGACPLPPSPPRLPVRPWGVSGATETTRDPRPLRPAARRPRSDASDAKASRPADAGTGFLHAGVLQKLVLVIASVETLEALERWTFDIEMERGRGGVGSSR